MTRQPIILNIAAFMLMLSIFITVDSCSDHSNQPNQASSSAKDFKANKNDSILLRSAFQYFHQDSTQQALKYGHMALEQAQSNGNIIFEMKANNLLGYIYLSWNDFEASIYHFMKGLKMAKEQKHSKEKLTALHGLGRTYNQIGEPGKSLNYLKEAEKIAREENFKPELGKIFLELGSTYTLLDNHDKALKQMNEAMKIAERTSDTTMIMYLLNNIGKTYQLLGNDQKGLEYLEKVLELNRDKQNMQAKAAALGNIGEHYLKIGAYNRAIEYIDRSLEVSKAFGFRIFTRDNYKLISEAFEKSSHPILALDYHKKYSALGDSIFNEEKSNVIKGIEQRYAQAEKDKKIEILEQHSKNQRQFLRFTVGIALLAIIVLILLFISLRLRVKLHKQEKNVLGEELNHKSRELVTLIMKANQKKKMLNEVEKTIEQLTTSDIKDLKKFTNDLKAKIKTTYDIDNAWDVLKTHFEEVHPAFFKTLQKLHPELSQNDLKLCAYIKINLSTKEIARMLNISDRSVQTSKYRIKKKMNLSLERNLIQYIIEL